jgi:hypothetical protein
MMGYWFVASLIGIMPTWISSKFFRERRVLVSNSSNKDNIDNYINEGGRERVQIEENEGGGSPNWLSFINAKILRQFLHILTILKLTNNSKYKLTCGLLIK